MALWHFGKGVLGVAKPWQKKKMPKRFCVPNLILADLSCAKSAKQKVKIRLQFCCAMSKNSSSNPPKNVKILRATTVSAPAQTSKVAEGKTPSKSSVEHEEDDIPNIFQDTPQKSAVNARLPPLPKSAKGRAGPGTIVIIDSPALTPEESSKTSSNLASLMQT